MSDYKTCPHCKESIYDHDYDRHIHMMKFRIYSKSHGQTEDDAKNICAFDHADAVEEWAEKDDQESAEYSIANGEDLEGVMVCEKGDDEWKEFEVSGETQPVYFASESF